MPKRKHLSSIAYYLQFAEVFRFDLLATITAKGLAAADEGVLHNAAIAAARQSAKHPQGLFDEICLPTARSLASRGVFSWTGGMFNWDQVALLKGLSAEQVDPLLTLMTEMPRLSSDGEAMLAVIAAEHVQAVIDLSGRRFQNDSKDGDIRYGDLPHGLHYLRAPLAAAPGEIVVRRGRGSTPIRRSRSSTAAGSSPSSSPTWSLRSIRCCTANSEQGREGIDFVLSVLRAYEGEQFLHPLLRAIVGFLPAHDELLNIVDIIIHSSGVLVGEYGSVEAQEARKALVAEWEAGENEAVRDFAARFIRSAENQRAMERRRADRTVALRSIEFDGS